MQSFTITARSNDTIITNIDLMVQCRTTKKIIRGEEELINHAVRRLKETIIKALEDKYPRHKVDSTQIFMEEHFISPTLFKEDL